MSRWRQSVGQVEMHAPEIENPKKELLAYAEIANFDVALGADEHVRGLEIHVYHLGVHIGHC